MTDPVKSPARAEAWPESLAEHLAERHKHLMLETEREAFQAAQSGDKARQSIASTESERHRAVYHAMCLIIAEENRRASPPAEALPSQTSGAEEKPVAWIVVDDEGHTLDFEKLTILPAGGHNLYLTKPASEPAGGGVDGGAKLRLSEDDRNIISGALTQAFVSATAGVTEAPTRSLADELLDWAGGRWEAEVKNRPLSNIHRRALDTTWRQVTRKLGGDPEALFGPTHDDLADALSSPASSSPAGAEALPAGVESLPYQVLFNAIAAATSPYGGGTGVNISVEKFRAALSSAPAQEDGAHGPHGYLVIIPGLDEERWYLRDDPETASGYVSLPMFTKVDPFKVAPSLSDSKATLADAGSDAEGRS